MIDSFSKTISELEVIPKGYGVAYYKPLTDQVVAYPIPLNLIVAIIWRFYVWVKSGAFRNKYSIQMSRIWAKAYEKGYKAGKCNENFRKGYNEGLKDGAVGAHLGYR